MATEDDTLRDARAAFDECVEAEAQNRAEAIDDLRFARMGEQWSDIDRKNREREGRPCLTINRLPSFIRQVVNDSRQNKPAIRCKPVDDNADPETAEIINGLIRNIEYSSNADIAYDTAVEFAVSAGVGYLRVDMDYAHDDTFDMDLRIERVANAFSIYGDPFSTAADSSDWLRAFVVDTMSKDAFRKKWKGADEVDWEALGYNGLQAPWSEDETIQVAEWWTREEVSRKIVQLSSGEIMDAARYQQNKDVFDLIGMTVTGERATKSWKVRQRIMTGAEILEDNPWPGIYIPIIPVYGEEVNIEGKRTFRSLIRDAKDPQRMFNYWRTTSTELVALAPRVPFIGPRGAFATDAAKWATANSVSHPFIEYDGPQPPQRQPLDTGSAAGALQEAMAASDDMKSIMGLYDASLGQRSNETSGRAILVRQREGDTSTFHFIDNMSRAIRHTGRILVDLIPSVYSGQRVLRILGEDGTSRNVAVNQPAQPQMDQQAPVMTVGQETPQQEGQETQQAIARAYDLTVGRYDVTVEAGPNFTTKREEAAMQMTELLRAYPAAAPIMMDLMVKNLDWPGAEEIAQRFKAMLPPPVQGQNPQMAQAQQQMQQMGQHIQQVEQKLQAADMDKSMESRKLDIAAFDAETKRLQVVHGGMTPQEIQALVTQTVMQLLHGPQIAEQQPSQPSLV